MEALDEVLTDREELYQNRPPEVLRVPILVQQSYIKYSIPTELYFETEVKGLKGGRAGGPLVMHAEDLKGWLRESPRKKEPVRRRWEVLVRLVQRMFGYGDPPA